MTTTLAPRTYLPATQSELNPIGDAFDASESPGPAFVLRGPHGDVPLPGPVYEILHQVVTAMQAGKAITVTPNEPVLTTQQAADLLGITRPTLVKLLDEDKMPYERMSTRRKVRLQDVLDYRDRRIQEQYEALAEISATLDDDDDLETMLARARAARKTVARRRGQMSRGQGG